MLKRTVVRLLMFGVPFSLSYIATRPAPPVAPAQTFVICAYGDHGRELIIAPEKAGCEKTLAGTSESDSQPGHPGHPGPVVPAVKQSQQTRPSSKPANDILF